MSGPASGTLTLTADGSFSYAPNGNFAGSDSFTYKAHDGTVDSNTVTVAITVTAVNDAPTAVADAFLASRLAGDHGRAFGTLAPSADVGAIVARAWPPAA